LRKHSNGVFCNILVENFVMLRWCNL